MPRIVDLSHVIAPGKAGRKFALEMVGAETVNPNVVRLEGQWYIMHNVSMVSHIATHIEAPYHILKHEADLAQLPLDPIPTYHRAIRNNHNLFNAKSTPAFRRLK